MKALLCYYSALMCVFINDLSQQNQPLGSVVLQLTFEVKLVNGRMKGTGISLLCLCIKQNCIIQRGIYWFTLKLKLQPSGHCEEILVETNSVGILVFFWCYTGVP